MPKDEPIQSGKTETSKLARRLDIPESAFKQSKFVRLMKDEVSRPVALPGIRLPSGDILVCSNEYISGAVRDMLTKTMSGEKVSVKGKWVFVPDES